MKILKLMLVALLVVGMPQDGWADYGNTFRFGGGYYFGAGGDDFFELAGGDGPGIYAEYEWGAGERFGLGIEVNFASLSGDDDPVNSLLYSGYDESTYLSLTLNPTFYLSRGARGGSLHAAPVIGLASFRWDDDSATNFLAGGRIGADIPFGDNNWVFTLRGNVLWLSSMEDPINNDDEGGFMTSVTFGFARIGN